MNSIMVQKTIALFFVFNFLSTQCMMVSFKRTARHKNSACIHNLPLPSDEVTSIKELKEYLWQQQQDALVALFDTKEEKNDFIKRMAFARKAICYEYRDPDSYYCTKDSWIKEYSKQANPRMYHAIKSVFAAENINSNAIVTLSSEHLYNMYSPHSFFVRWKLRQMLRQLNPDVCPRKEFAQIKSAITKTDGCLLIGGIITKNAQNDVIFVPPYFLFSSNIESCDPESIKMVAERTLGLVSTASTNTTYHLGSQITNDYRLEKFIKYVTLQKDIAMFESALNDPDVAASHFLASSTKSPFYPWHKKIVECHLYDQLGNDLSE